MLIDEGCTLRMAVVDKGGVGGRVGVAVGTGVGATVTVGVGSGVVVGTAAVFVPLETAPQAVRAPTSSSRQMNVITPRLCVPPCVYTRR